MELFYSVDKEDEICCLIKGCNFLLKNIPDEVFIYQRHGSPEYKFQGVEHDIFPYLLVNIGSGVSLVKVSHYENTPMQYTEKKFGCKNFQWKNFDIFLIFAQNIDCGYTLVLTSTHNLCFGAKIRKIGIPLQTPVLLYKIRV